MAFIPSAMKPDIGSESDATAYSDIGSESDATAYSPSETVKT
jgi:hypothetical protein